MCLPYNPPTWIILSEDKITAAANLDNLLQSTTLIYLVISLLAILINTTAADPPLL